MNVLGERFYVEKTYLVSEKNIALLFPGYREELYSRLEIRRILEDHEKPKRPKLKQKSLVVKPVCNEKIQARVKCVDLRFNR